MKMGNEILEKSYRESYKDRRIAATIKTQLQYMHNQSIAHNEEPQMEKIKDLWSTLFMRLHKEFYYISRLIIPEYEKIIGVTIKKEEIEINTVDIVTEDGSLDMYKEIFDRTNERVDMLKKVAIELMNSTDNEDLRTSLRESMRLYDRVVPSCVARNKEATEKIIK